MILVAMMLATAVHSAAPQPRDPLAEARSFYEAGDFARARDLFGQDLEGVDLTPDQVRSCRIYLAASYYYLKDVDAARRQLEVLFRANPYARIDPVLFPPEIVQLGDQVLAHLADEASKAPPPSKPAPAAPPPPAPSRSEANPFPASADTSVPTPSTPARDAAQPTGGGQGPQAPPALGYSFIPFGGGQFANGQSGKGIAVAVLEGLAVAGFGTTAVLAEGLKTGGTPFLTYQVAPQNQATFQAYETTYLACFWVGVGIYAVGVVDSILSRPSAGTPAGSTAARWERPLGRTGLVVGVDAAGVHW